MIVNLSYRFELGLIVATTIEDAKNDGRLG